MKQQVGLVLTGGGARGAYQAGVLVGISELMGTDANLFPIITGISAGTINAAFLACYKGSFKESAKRLWDIWSTLKSDRVFHQTKTGFASIALRALMNIYFGNVVKSHLPDALLDSAPLNQIVRELIDVDAIKLRIDAGELTGVSFSATNFNTGMVTSFYEADSSILPWKTKDRLGQKTKLNHKHVMASSAIPGIFKLEEIDNEYFGDGSTRVTFPLAPAIRLGANKIIAIDMRCAEMRSCEKIVPAGQSPKLGEIFASLLDAIFSDSLDRDVERLTIVNELVLKNESHPKWRCIDCLLIRPSQHLGEMAKETYHTFSPHLRRILSVFGQSEATSADLMSHLAFETVYIAKLLHLGREDALRRQSEIRPFFE